MRSVIDDMVMQHPIAARWLHIVDFDPKEPIFFDKIWKNGRKIGFKMVDVLYLGPLGFKTRALSGSTMANEVFSLLAWNGSSTRLVLKTQESRLSISQ